MTRQIVFSRLIFITGAVLVAFVAAPLHAQFAITFNDGDSFSAPLSVTSPDTGTLTIAAGAATQTGDITGTGNVSKLGVGALTLSGATGYSGNTTVSAGTLILSSESDQTLSGNISLSGGATLRKDGSNTLTIAAGKNISAAASSAGTFDLADGSLTLAGNTLIGGTGGTTTTFTGNGTVAVGTANTLTLGAGSVLNGNLAIVGTGTLALTQGAINSPNVSLSTTTITGPGTGQTFTLNADLTLPTLTAWAGTLAINGHATLASATMSSSTTSAKIADGDSLTINSGASLQGSITGTGNTTAALTGTVGTGTALSLSGSGGTMNVSGTLTVNAAGTLTLGANTAIAPFATIGNGGFGTVVLSGVTIPSSAIISAATLQGPAAAATTTVTGPFTFPTLMAWGGTLRILGSDTVTITSGATTGTMAGVDLANDATLAGAIAIGTSTFTKTGGGLFTANVTASSTGTFNFTAGTFVGALTGGTNNFTGNSTLGAPTSGLNLSAGNGTSVVLQGNVTVADAFPFSTTTGSSANLTVTGSASAPHVAFSGDGTVPDHINVSGNGTLSASFGGNLSAIVAVSGNGALTNLGDTSTGAIDVVAMGGTFDLAGGNVAFNSLSGTGGTIFNNTSDTNLVLSLGAAASAVVPVPALSGFTTNIYSGNITDHTTGTGTIALTKTGPGALTLSGTNSYSGPTLVSSGTLQFGKEVSLYGGNSGAWTAANLTVNSGATAAFNVGGTGEFTVSDILTLAALGDATSGFKSGASIGLDPTNAAGGIFAFDQVLANPNGGANALGLVKLGTGTLTLSAANSYSGPTLVSRGTLQFAKEVALYGGNPSAWTAANLSVNSGATAAFNVGGTGEFTVSDILTLAALGDATSGFKSGAAIGLDTTNATGGIFAFDQVLANPNGGANALGLVKLGTGTLTLSRPNTYTGATNIIAGVLSISNASALGSSATISSGAALELQGNITVSGTTLSLAGTGPSSTGALRNLSGTNIWSGSISLAAAASIQSDAGSLGISGALTGSNTGLTLAGAATGNLSTAFNLGTGALTKTGTGTWTISGSNTLGSTTINGGTLVLGGSSALGVSSNSLTLSTGGTLDLHGTSPTLASLNGTGGTLLNDGSGTSTLALSSSGTFAGTIIDHTTGSGKVALSKATGGTLTLSGANTYTGGTTIAAGTLALGASGVLADTGAVTISGGTLDLGAFNETIGALSFSSGAITGTGTLTASSFAFTISSPFTIATPLASSGALTKTGTGTLTLSGADSYTGPTSITGGILVAAHATALGTSAAGTTVASGGMLELSGGIAVGAEALSLAGTGSAGLGALRNISGANSWAGLLTLTADATIAAAMGTLAFTNPGTITGDNFNLTLTGGSTGSIASSIGTGTGTLTKIGAGTWTLSGANTYTGGTTISAGTLAIGNGGTTGSLSGNIVDNATLVFNRSDALAFAGAISGTGALQQNGAGVLTLSGAHTYTGATSINSGVLLINGSLAHTATAIASGATLGGTGSIGGLTTVANGAHLAPGDFSAGASAPGTLTFTSGLTLTAGAILDFQLGATSDLVRVFGGALTSGSGLMLNLSDAGGFAAGHYTLFDFSSGSTDVTGFHASDFTLGTAPAGYTYDLTIADGALVLAASASAIPEPATSAAIAGALVLGGAVMLRRKRQGLGRVAEQR